MEKSQTPPSEYLSSLPTELRVDIGRLDDLISRSMAGHPKVMWEGKFWGGGDQRIIGYGDYTYQTSNREIVEWFVVGLAAQKNYISIYVNATDDDGYITERFADKLGKAKVGKSSISFTSVDDIDLDQLSALIEEARRLMT